MKVLVSGAAGFIGRWVVGELLARGHEVVPIDNLATGDAANLAEFQDHPRMRRFEISRFVNPSSLQTTICRRSSGS